MKQIEFNLSGLENGVKKVRDITEKGVSYNHSLFSPKQYDTEFFYYTEVVADWLAVKRGNG